jgi:hypothetical protein
VREQEVSTRGCLRPSEPEAITYVKLVKPRRVKVASGSYIHGIGLGNVTIWVFTDKLEVKELTLTDVLHVPQLAGNLISVAQLQSPRVV